MTHHVRDTAGAEMNRYWKRQQAALQQKPASEPRQALPAADKPPVIHPAPPPAPVIIEIDPASVLVQGGLPKAKKFALTKPITVRRMGECYMLVDGKRRLAAALMMKMKTIRAEVEP